MGHPDLWAGLRNHPVIVLGFGMPITERGVGTTEAEALAIRFDEAAEVHALAATGTNHAFPFCSGQFRCIDMDANPLLTEELGIG